ncbi:MAG TPA: hypothetical protein VHE30_03005 [Polyangiaceae bacterium]|nr:hypothetical protein [Polyangiaceae bacterium]
MLRRKNHVVPSRIALASALALALTAAGCGSDGSGGTSAGASGGGSGGASGPGAGGSAGSSESSGGSTATGGAGETGGATGSGGATGTGGTNAGTGGTGSGGVAAGGASGSSGTGGGGTAGGTGVTTSCDTQACEDCFRAAASGDCAAVDNPCNDDSSCDPKEQTWIGCICRANGDGTATAACDATFQSAHSTAPDIISCARASCTACYAASSGTECKIVQFSCQDCILAECGAERTACGQAAACGSNAPTLGGCACAAQLGQSGTVAACLDAMRANGPEATAFVNCGVSHCADVCGL